MANTQMEDEGILDSRIIANAERLTAADWKQHVARVPADRKQQLRSAVNDCYFMKPEERMEQSALLQNTLAKPNSKNEDWEYRRVLANIYLFPERAIGLLWVALDGAQDYW